MDRTITAQDFLDHCEAGLTLWELAEYGYEWVGTTVQWQHYQNLATQHEG